MGISSHLIIAYTLFVHKHVSFMPQSTVSQTDRQIQTDRRQHYANSRSYCLQKYDGLQNDINFCFTFTAMDSQLICRPFHCGRCNIHHRLRGSGSTVVTMTSKVHGKTEILTTCRSETPENIEAKRGVIDYVMHPNNLANFCGNRSKGVCSPYW